MRSSRLLLVIAVSAALAGSGCNADNENPAPGTAADTAAATVDPDAPARGLKNGEPTATEIAAALSEHTADGLKINAYKVPSKFVKPLSVEKLQARKIDRREGVEYFEVNAIAIVELIASGSEIVETIPAMAWRPGISEAELRDGVFNKIGAKKALEGVPGRVKYSFPITAMFHTIDGNLIIDEARSGEAAPYASPEELVKKQQIALVAAPIARDAIERNLPHKEWLPFIALRLKDAGISLQSTDYERYEAVAFQIIAQDALARQEREYALPSKNTSSEWAEDVGADDSVDAAEELARTSTEDAQGDDQKEDAVELAEDVADRAEEDARNEEMKAEEDTR